MAENSFKTNSFKKPDKEKKSKSGKKSTLGFSFFKDPRLILALGFFFIIVSLFLLTAFISYVFTGKADQSVIEGLSDTSLVDSGKDASNWLGLYGAVTSHYMIFRWMGISAFFMPPLLFFLGFKLVFKRDLIPLFSSFVFSVFAVLWMSLLLGYITHSMAGVTEIGFLSGGLVYEPAKLRADILLHVTYLS